MAKLIVEVIDAADLMPKDGQGSASPFVEVDFHGQRQRTQTKHRDLYPAWNETLVFKVDEPRDLPHSTIEVTLYNDRKASHQRNFLGRVRISGDSVPFSDSEAAVQRYPLDKRGLFSHIRGDVALRIYALRGPYFSNQPPPPEQEREPRPQPQPQHHHHVRHGDNLNGPFQSSKQVPILEEVNTNHFDFGKEYKEYEDSNHKAKKKEREKEKEVRSFYSVGTGGGGAPAAPPPVTVESRSNFMKAGPPNMMHMQYPGQRPPLDFGLVETRPPLAARMGYRGADKTSTTYDLVEQMHFLYVNVVKARDLPVMDITGSLDPYVEVKLGNYRG